MAKKKTIKKDEAKEPKVDEPKAEKPEVEETKVEKPKKDESPKDEPKAEKPEVENKPKTETKFNEKNLKKIEKKMVAKINSQPKVKVFVPLEGNEKKGVAFTTVQINGYTWQIMKGFYTEVPEAVANILMDSLEQTAEAHRKAMEKVADDERMEFDNSN